MEVYRYKLSNLYCTDTNGNKLLTYNKENLK